MGRGPSNFHVLSIGLCTCVTMDFGDDHPCGCDPACACCCSVRFSWFAFLQPPSFAAARMPPLLSESSVTINTRCPAACAQLDAANPSLSITALATALAYYRSGANSVANSQILAPAPTNDDAAVSSTLSRARPILSYARFTDETSRSDLAIPSAVRSGLAIQLSAWPVAYVAPHPLT